MRYHRPMACAGVLRVKHIILIDASSSDFVSMDLT